ncbi:MAG: nitroreductase family protein [Acidobacteriia bacterium]|nr:nitroreductase family protein [Terriglobia bacterium]
MTQPSGSSPEKTLSQATKDRRATPSFLPDPVPENDLKKILDAGLSAPSAYNLQPWRFVVVRDAEQRARLRQAAMKQPKVEEAPVVIVACADLEGWRRGDLDEVIRLAQHNGYGDEARYASTRKNISSLFDSAPGAAGGLAPDFAVWANRQTMIAFTTMMWMAEVLGYDTAPMEGFYEDQVKAALGIPAHVRVVALLAIGHRKGEDKLFAGRFAMQRTVFAEKWGNPIP